MFDKLRKNKVVLQLFIIIITSLAFALIEKFKRGSYFSTFYNFSEDLVGILSYSIVTSIIINFHRWIFIRKFIKWTKLWMWCVIIMSIFIYYMRHNVNSETYETYGLSWFQKYFWFSF